MASDTIRLKRLLQDRHWQTFGTFCREYDKAAAKVDELLVGTAPSRPQFHRWLSGALTKLPHSHHCQVLEAMLPGWTARQLFEPSRPHEEALPKTTNGSDVCPARNQYADVARIFTSRAEFAAQLPPEKLLDGAREIRAVGLSLNLLCQQYSDRQWRRIVDRGARLRALFLDPDGRAVQDREVEEGFEQGHLSGLTRLNIRTLLRVKDHLGSEGKSRVEIGTYDEPIRFNIVLVDGKTCVAQPYLPETRGVDSPTLLIHRCWPEAGLYSVFEGVFESMWARKRSL